MGDCFSLYLYAFFSVRKMNCLCHHLPSYYLCKNLENKNSTNIFLDNRVILLYGTYQRQKV